MRPAGERVLRLALALAASAPAGCSRPEAEEARLRALADSFLPRIEALAGLEARAPVRVEMRDRAALRAYVVRRLDEELPAAELAGIEAAYRLFGLLPDTLRLRPLLVELYTEQVVGYYDPPTRTLYLVRGVPRAALRPVLAHELVHALQDQHADLDSLIARRRGNDRQAAAQAALEGHATAVMFGFLLEEQAGRPVGPAALPDLADRLASTLEAENERFPVFRAAPRIVRETVLFPYVRGAAFVQALWRARPGARPPAPLGPLLPQSTEQVLHPAARFLARHDEPTEVELAPLPAEGPWRTVYENTLGEFETRVLLTEHLGEGADTAAEGWDGDRYRVLESAAGARALVWVSVWDDDAAADRFAAAYRAVQARRGPGHAGRVERIALAGRPAVRAVEAPAGTPLDAVPVPAVLRLGTDTR